MIDGGSETRCGSINEDRRALLTLAASSTSRWTALQFPRVDGVFYVTSRLIPPAEIYHDKVIFLKQEEDGLLCRTRINDSPYKEKWGLSLAQAEEQINKIDPTFLCRGSIWKISLDDGPLEISL
ncbi:hypothetical protein MTO96_044732 [Rhipicephalus appendiculatus]